MGERELRGVLDRISAAERRTGEAEGRARAAVARIEGREGTAPPPMPEAAEIPQPPEEPGAEGG